MSGFLALFVLAVLFGMVWLAWLVATAPEGRQSERGFEYGPPFIADERDGTDFKSLHDAGRERADALASPRSLDLHDAADRP